MKAIFLCMVLFCKPGGVSVVLRVIWFNISYDGISYVEISYDDISIAEIISY